MGIVEGGFYLRKKPLRFQVSVGSESKCCNPVRSRRLFPSAAVRNTVKCGPGNGGQMKAKKQAKVKKSCNGTVTRLNEAAFKIVDERGDEIADSLMESALKGHVLSTKLLIELAKGNPEMKKALMKGPFRSLAMDLAAEPKWPRELADADTETDVD
jgi:hypothetical protein